ncbi:MAG: hypothetical protein J6C86_09680 [Bacteroidaceae bacterium]|nr:hypothetical protein [Bacteroidaceae bacterium]
MKNFRRNGILLLVLCLMSTTMCWGQKHPKENPRGIYRMASLVEKNGREVVSPFDQYKICTDSITLNLNIMGTKFSISKEESILNYTGEKPDKKQAHAIRIYDSNAEHFTLKWWSSFSNHLYFPENGWCTEFYVANSYSEKGKALFKALTQPAPAANPKHPLYGNWHRIISVADDLDKVKEKWETLSKQENADEKYSGTNIIIISENYFIYSGGEILNAESDGKDFLILQGNTPSDSYKLPVIWLPNDYAVVARPYNNHTVYELWKRITDDVPPISHIVASFVNK